MTEETSAERAAAFDLVGSLQLPRDEASIRIVAVADLDLPSASALAEYALTDSRISGGQVDVIIACGPFCRDEDLAQYMTRRRPQPMIRRRTPELTAALEGLMTGALSQLESIVCRVCFCPAGPQDPETTLVLGEKEGPLRLTPNSRNIHGEWLQLAPALGCGGLSVMADETFQKYRPELSRQVQQLLELAPETKNTDISFTTDHSQTILVTTNVNLATIPMADYVSSLTDTNVCLNLVGGTAQTIDCAPDGSIRVVSPGSLRQHGDFCCIDLGLMEDDVGAFRWQVHQVEFDNIHCRSGAS